MYLLFAINICRFHKAEGVQQEKDMICLSESHETQSPLLGTKQGLKLPFFLASLMAIDSFDFTSQKQFSTCRVKKTTSQSLYLVQ